MTTEPKFNAIRLAAVVGGGVVALLLVAAFIRPEMAGVGAMMHRLIVGFGL